MYKILFQQNCSYKNIDKKKNSDAFDLQNMKNGTVFLYFHSYYSLLVADFYCYLFVIRHSIWQMAEICVSYRPTVAMDIAHNTTLNY